MGFVYVLQCVDKSYYVGSTKSIEKRLVSHKSGRVKYTKNRRPLELKFVKSFDSYQEAFGFEKKVKSWKKRKSVEKMFEKEDNIYKVYWGIV